MSAHELLPPWLHQPQEAIRINWLNPLTRDMVFCAIPVGLLWQDLVSGLRSTSRSGALITTRTTASGSNTPSQYLRGSSAGFNRWAEQTGLDLLTGPLTLFADGAAETSGQYRAILQTWSGIAGEGIGITIDDSVSATNSVGAILNNSYANSGVFGALGTNSSLWSHRIAFALDGSKRYHYASGRLVASINDTRLPTASSSRRTYVGNNAGSGSGFDVSGSLLVAWSRPLSLSEYQELYTNPWQLFESSRIYIPIVQSVAIPILGSTTATPLDSTRANISVSVTFA